MHLLKDRNIVLKGEYAFKKKKKKEKRSYTFFFFFQVIPPILLLKENNDWGVKATVSRGRSVLSIIRARDACEVGCRFLA